MNTAHINLECVSTLERLLALAPRACSELTLLCFPADSREKVDEASLKVYFSVFKSHMAIARDGRKLVGVAMLVPVYSQPVAILRNVAVHHQYRHQGIAAKLLDMLVVMAKSELGLKCLWFSCEKGNEAANRLYRSCGFVMCKSTEADNVYLHNLGEELPDDVWEFSYNLENRPEESKALPS